MREAACTCGTSTPGQGLSAGTKWTSSRQASTSRNVRRLTSNRGIETDPSAVWTVAACVSSSAPRTMRRLALPASPHSRLPRCLFAPHPRSLVLALPNAVMCIHIRGASSDGVSDVGVDSRVLAVAFQSASSVPVNRYRRVPERPQPIRDFFFLYQMYRAAQREPARLLTARHTKHEVGKHSEGEHGEQEEQQHQMRSAEPISRPSLPAFAELPERSGELLDCVGVPGSPFVLAVLSSSYVQLVDIRHSEQPLVEWQHEQRYSGDGGRRPQLLAYARTDNEQSADRHVLLIVSESSECAVLLYHCVLASAASNSSADAATRTTSFSAAPQLRYASMRLPSFGDVAAPSASAFQLLPFTVQPLVGLCALLTPQTESNSSNSSSSLPPFSLLHLSRSGALMLQRWSSVSSGELASSADSRDGALESESATLLPLPESTRVSAVLFPSDDCSPACLHSAAVRRHDVLELSSAMSALLHGRQRATQRRATPPPALSTEAVLDALYARSSQLRRFMLSPRSATEIAQHCAHKQWIQQLDEHAEDGDSAWHLQLAHHVYFILHTWAVRSPAQGQHDQQDVTQPPVPVLHFHPRQHSTQMHAASPKSRSPLSPRAASSAATPCSLRRCRCESFIVGRLSSEQCCPGQCCDCSLCVLPDSVMFHSHETVLPHLSFRASSEEEKRSDEAGRGVPQQRMDLSQDVGTLLQLVSQPASASTPAAAAAAAAGVLYGQSDSSEPRGNPRACSELLASMSRQWQGWQVRASEGSIAAEAQRAEAQVADLDGGWQGLRVTADQTAVRHGARDEEVEDMQSWQELANDAMDDDDD